jgi:hypothetical protein
MKTCSKCNTEKSDDNFYKTDNYKDGLHCWCNDCRKSHYNKNNKKLYAEKNISKEYLKSKSENFQELKYQKNKKCPICKKPLMSNQWFDNDIETEFREYCPCCNFLKSMSKIYSKMENAHTQKYKTRFELKIGHWYRIFFDRIPREAFVEFGKKIKSKHNKLNNWRLFHEELI